MSVNRDFILKPESEFIELMKLLKAEKIAQTGGHAKILIENEEVKVNGEIELRKRKKLRKGDLVEIEDYQIKIV
jgi:ribosome-associated protein